MKKLILCALSLFCFLSMTMVCYAGDVPESLLNDDSAQVYFAEVKHADEEGITVIPYKNVKGEFLEGKEFTYGEFTVTDSPIAGEKYLCGFINEDNPLYIWEVSSLETKNLKIENSDAMSKRMQEYLNNGEFEKKEQERISRPETGEMKELSAPKTEALGGNNEQGMESGETGEIGKNPKADALSGNIVENGEAAEDQTSRRIPIRKYFGYVLVISGIILLGVGLTMWKKDKRK